jgi:hypothetical protein
MSGPINLSDVIRKHQRFVKLHEAMVEREAREAGEHAEAFVFQSPGFKPQTGALQRATQARVIRSGKRTLIVRVSNKKAYAAAIDRGSRAHVIRARSGKALRFQAGGQTLYRRSVNHPGTRAYRFLYRATNSAGRILKQGLVSGMARVAQRF